VTRREVLFRHVRDALASLYDPVHLQTHALTGLLALPKDSGTTAGEALRKLLWETIESLRPDASIPQNRPEWLNYRLLWLHYVQFVSLADTCRELGLSQRSFYRRQREAIEAVASVLWERHLLKESAPSPADLSPADRARDEAVRLARQAQRQPVDLCAILHGARETIQPLVEQQGLMLHIVCPSSLPLAYGDPALFHQIVLNVLTEGLRLAGEGALLLTVECQDTHTLWQLSGLADSSSEEAATPSGGLAISAALLEVYGGRLWTERDAQDRTVICFALPYVPPRDILIVDDDQSTIALYRRYLEEHDYVVRSARSAEEVEEQLAQAPPDVVLLDVLMPQEDGWRVLQRLKALPETQAIPVVICSVLSQPSLALALGAARVLQKPIAEDELLAAIREVLVEP